MANTHGLNGSLSIAAVAIGDLTDLDISFDQDLADTTNKDSAGWKEQLGGHRSATITGTFIWNDSGAGQDAGQEDVLDAWFAQTAPEFIYLMETAAGAEKWTGNFNVESVQPTTPNTDANAASFTLKSNGAVVRGTQ